MNNNLLNVALCSYGMSGQVFHAPLIAANPFLNLHTILQRNSNSAQKKYSIIKIAKRFDEILQDSAIHVVVVNTPNEFHFEMAKQALLSGKHVVIEKPITIFPYQAEELIDLAKEKNLILTVFHNKRLESDFLAMQEVVHNQYLGNIVEVNWRYDRFRTHLTHKVWKEDDREGAGTLYDLGIHLIDSAITIFGKPLAITAHERILRENAGSTDYFNIRLDYENLTVNLGSSTMVKYKSPLLVAHGTKGSFVFQDSDIQEEQLKNGISPNEFNFGINTQNSNYQLYLENEKLEYQIPKGKYAMFYEKLYQAIQNQTKLLVQPEEALYALKVLSLAQESNKKGKTIYL